LSKLTAWSGNVRKTGVSDGIDELSASIAAHGLLQSLVVQPGKRGKYRIIAGQRRFIALCKLAGDGKLAKDYPVPCVLAEGTADATELSLAENTVRAPMHPADQFEAYRTLNDAGALPADIAARFGISELAVTQRLKLGRLSPNILAAYRDGEIDLECAQAFTLTDDHETQERVFDGLTRWNRDPQTIRRALTEEEVPSSEKRVRFVGLEAYVEAGGVVRRDLFNEDDSGYATDVALLDRLVTDKLRSVADTVAGEGWKWTEVTPDIDHQALSRFTRSYPERILTADQEVEFAALSSEYNALVDSDDDVSDRLEEIEARLNVLDNGSETWTPETLAVAGAIITLSYKGEVRIERGLVRKEDVRNLPRATESADGAATAPVRNALPERLIAELTAEKSAAIGATMMDNRQVALAAVVHVLALCTMFPATGKHSCLTIGLTAPGLGFSMSNPDASKGLAAILAAKDRMGDVLPGNPDQLWAWCLGRSQDELLDVLAFLAGYSVDCVRQKGQREDSSRLAHGDRLADALALDMSGWYAPTAEGFFSRISRTAILEAIDEAKGAHAPALAKLKKTELAARAESAIAGTGWLPQPLRPSDDTASPEPTAA
jgi:ParB family chromosome partitioning protein